MSETLERDAIDSAIAPLLTLLSYGEDVAVNKPGEAWHYHEGKWNLHFIPKLTESRLRGIATLASAQHRPRDRQTIISTDIPTGHRLEAILPPAVLQGTVALCFRRADEYVSPAEDITKRFNVDRWNKWGQRKARETVQRGELLALYDAGNVEGFLAAVAKQRLTPLFCGATGAGKTFILKTYITLLDINARILVVEDAREAVLLQPNHVRLIFQKGGVTPHDLLVTSLRLRPDFVALQELRNPESAAIYLDQCMAGHPGSPTTIHGRTAAEAARRLFEMIMQSSHLNSDTLIEMMATAIDVIVPIENERGVRSFGEIWFAADAARRGETFADLLRRG